METYKSIDKEIKNFLEKSLKENPEAIQATSNIITSSRDSNAENLKTVIENLFYGVTSPLLVLPPHLCLYKYYEISRYPGGKIQEEEYKTIPKIIELLKEVHKTVEYIIQLYPELELRLD